MGPFEELERMALNAAKGPDCEASPTDITRGQRLFSYPSEEAADMIEKHMSDYTRRRISVEYWEMVLHDLETWGYDRNAYEHELAINAKRPPPVIPSKSQLSAFQARAIFLVELEGPLSTPEDVRIAAGLATKPDLIQGKGDDGDESFSLIGGLVKQTIVEWLAKQKVSFVPTFARLAQKAEKDLSAVSIFPTLDIDSTLPQYRAANRDTIFESTQEQFPVLHFFYGTLADSTILSQQLRLPEGEAPTLLPSCVVGETLRRGPANT